MDDDLSALSQHALQTAEAGGVLLRGVWVEAGVINVLILDDVQARHHLIGSTLERKFGSAQVTIHSVYDKEAALTALCSQDYDLIYLDHDLGDGSREVSGAHVAKFLSEHPDCQRQAKIIVHSMNPPGANRMLGWLKDRPKVRYIPFALLVPHA